MIPMIQASVIVDLTRIVTMAHHALGGDDFDVVFLPHIIFRKGLEMGRCRVDAWLELDEIESQRWEK